MRRSRSPRRCKHDAPLSRMRIRTRARMHRGRPSHMKLTHDLIERNLGLMIVLVILVVSVGGLVEIVPLFYQRSTTEPVAGLKPYTALQLSGRDIYIREGCNNCHSQMIRPFRAETERYGHYSVAGEFVYD